MVYSTIVRLCEIRETLLEGIDILRVRVFQLLFSYLSENKPLKVSSLGLISNSFTGFALHGPDLYSFKNGMLHRENNPAVKFGNSYEEWWLEGKLHRENGPATKDLAGNQYWYIHGRIHREDGPAVITHYGKKSWYLNGNGYLSQEEWFDALAPEQKEKALWNMDNW